MDRNSFQTAVLALVAGAFAMGVFMDFERPTVSKVQVVGAAVPTSELNTKMANALSKRSLADHKMLYKIFKGMSEYASNGHKFDTTIDAMKAVSEVMSVYDVKGKFTEVADIVDVQLSVLKTPAKFVDKKDEVVRLFNELGEAVRYSADKLPKTK